MSIPDIQVKLYQITLLSQEKNILCIKKRYFQD